MLSLFVQILFVVCSSTSAAQLSLADEQAVQARWNELSNARAQLIERATEFNRREQSLQNLLSKNPTDFNAAAESLQLSEADRQNLKTWFASQDTKSIKRFVDKQLVRAYQALVFDRADWEKMFSEPSMELLNNLRAVHEAKAAKSRAQAVVDSQKLGISLKALKDNPETLKAFCSELPKGAILHTHPYGTMDRATVEKALATLNPRIDRAMIEDFLIGTVENIHPLETQFLKNNADFYSQPRSYNDVRERYPQDAEQIVNFFFVPEDENYFNAQVTPFSRFLAAFVLPLQMFGITSGNTDNQLALEKMLYNDMFARNIAQHVSYIELTRNLPVLKTSRQFSDRYDSLLEWTENTSGIAPRTLFSFNRTGLTGPEKRVAQVTTMTQLLSMKPSPYVVGINLMGDESIVDALDAAQLIYGKLLVENLNRETGLQATIHAGELGDVRNLRDALVFGVRRIGHGIKLTENPMYLELAVRSQTAIEISLTSNEILKVKPIAQNPYLYFLRLGLAVSLSTDDEGMFKTHPNRECELAVSRTDIEYSELKQMILNSVETSFADTKLKAELSKSLREELAGFEAKWANH